MAVPSLVNRIWTGFFENCSANFPLNDTFPDSSIVICIATRVTGGVTTMQNSSSDMFFRSNIAFTLFLYFGADHLRSNGVFHGNKDMAFSAFVQSTLGAVCKT